MCTKPYKGFAYGETKNGKPNYIICSYDTHHLEIRQNDSYVKAKHPFVSDDCKKAVFEFIEIPCGKCLECRLEYSRQWADRCMLEAQLHDENCFITLTYDDNNIRTVDDVDPDTGEIVVYKTLDKEDLQKFIRSLRDWLNYHKPGCKIRYFAAGEYGEQTLRPHLHLIVFGWKPDETDLQLLKMSSLGYAYYKSKLLEELWPYGNNLVAECSWETCAYVARYCVKKYKTDKNPYKGTKIVPEFVTMSRRPGIGLDWLISHHVCYANFLNQYISTPNGSRKISSNRYFDSYVEKTDPELFEKMKKIRKHFQHERKKLDNHSSELPYLQRLDIKERNLIKRTKVLERTNVV